MTTFASFAWMRRSMVTAAVCAAALAAAIVIGSCGAGGTGRVTTRSTHPQARILDVYASVPDGTADGAAIATGLRFGLGQVADRAGGARITYRALSDGRSGWSEPMTAAAASRAATDPRAVFYVGDLSPSANAVSAPILAQARIPQLSPAALPSGTDPAPSFLQVGTAAETQADAIGGELEQQGCSRVVITAPSTLPAVTAVRTQIVGTLRGSRGTSVSDHPLPSFSSIAGQEQQTLAAIARLRATGAARRTRSAYDELQSNLVHMQGLRQLAAQTVASVGVSRADCVVIAAETTTNAVPLAREVHTVNRHAEILGAVISCSAEGTTLLPSLDCVSPGLPLASYAGTAAFAARYRLMGGDPSVAALYGAQAAQMFLSAVNGGAGQAPDREALLDALTSSRAALPVVERYSFPRSAHPQVTFSGLRVVQIGRSQHVDTATLVPYQVVPLTRAARHFTLSDAADPEPGVSTPQ